MKINAQPVRGTKDFLPNEAELRDYVQGKIADTYKLKKLLWTAGCAMI